jgi:hypothetical protein
LLEENNFDKMLTAIDTRLKELAAKEYLARVGQFGVLWNTM